MLSTSHMGPIKEKRKTKTSEKESGLCYIWLKYISIHIVTRKSTCVHKDETVHILFEPLLLCLNGNWSCICCWIVPISKTLQPSC